MGQYYNFVNITKREYVDLHKIGGVKKFYEWLGTGEYMDLIGWLLRKSDESGGGDVDETHIEKTRYLGRWANDRVSLIGDYDSSHLYEFSQKRFIAISKPLKKEVDEYCNH